MVKQAKLSRKEAYIWVAVLQNVEVTSSLGAGPWTGKSSAKKNTDSCLVVCQLFSFKLLFRHSSYCFFHPHSTGLFVVFVAEMQRIARACLWKGHT